MFSYYNHHYCTGNDDYCNLYLTINCNLRCKRNDEMSQRLLDATRREVVDNFVLRNTMELGEYRFMIQSMQHEDGSRYSFNLDVQIDVNIHGRIYIRFDKKNCTVKSVCWSSHPMDDKRSNSGNRHLTPNVLI